MAAAVGIGVGLAVAAYGLIYSVLLRPLPYSQPDRLVQVSEITQADTGTLSETFRDLLSVEPSPFQGIASYNAA